MPWKKSSTGITKHLNIYIPAKQYRALQIEAVKLKTSINKLVYSWIKNKLENLEKKHF